MNNRFDDVMSKKTDEALRYILEAPDGTYQDDALTAARKEWDKRQMGLSTESPPVTVTVVTDEEAPFFEPKTQPKTQPETQPEAEPEPYVPAVGQERPVERYPALRLIAGFYNVMAWLVVVAVVLGLAGLAAMEILTGWWVAGLIVGGGLLFVTCMALSEVIKLFIDMEKNTRHGVKHQ